MSRRPLRILGVGPGRSINFLRWAWSLAERGHEVHVASTQWSERPGERNGFEAHDLRSHSVGTRIPVIRHTRLGDAARQIAKELDVDLVHGHYLLPFGYWAAQTGVHPLVLSPWGTDILIDAQRPGRGQRRARAALGAADFLVTNSTANEDASSAFGVERTKMRRIIWYADVERFTPARFDSEFRARLGWPQDAWIIVSLRNHRANMNLDVVVDAFARVVSEEPRAHLVMAARPSLQGGEIAARVERLGLGPRVHFASAGREELPGLVASCDVLVSVTSSDSTPASLLEGMASALPAVCATAPSIDEWVQQGVGAEIVEPRDVAGTARALLRLARDPGLACEYGERNAGFVRERVGDPGRALEDLYYELAAT